MAELHRIETKIASSQTNLFSKNMFSSQKFELISAVNNPSKKRNKLQH